jgi:DNA-binding NtrC family response regulator
MRVLVVDDEEVIRRLLGNMLARLGHEVLTAKNGCEAVNCLSSNPKSIEVLITDLKMPEMDGHATIREARRIRPNLGLVLMSANPEGTAPEEAVFLPKPFTLERLAECLDQAHQAKRRHQRN